jgi:hypothetical protein
LLLAVERDPEVMRRLLADRAAYTNPHIETHARPIAARDGHDLPGLIDERVPGVAAVVDDIVEGFEDPV